MKSKIRFRSFLGVALSLVMVVGMITIPEPRTVSAEDTNLITNGDFETGSLANGYSGATVVSTIKHGGSYAAKVTGGNLLMFSTDGVDGGSPMTADKQYKLSAYVYAEEDTTIKVFVPRWGNPNWDHPEMSESDLCATVNVTAGTWTLLEYILPARSYENLIQPRYSNTEGKVFYIDDITLTEYVPDHTNTNLVKYGDFETGALGNGYSGGTVVDTVKHGGTYAAQVTNNTSLMFSTDTTAGDPIEANKEYRLSAYVYAEDDASIEVYVPTWDSNWKNGLDAGKTTVNVKAKTWTRIDHTITAADYARILQPRYTRWDSKTFYIDDITLTEIAPEDTNLVRYGDFETGALANGYSGGTVVDTVKHGGTYAAQVSNSTSLMFSTDTTAGDPIEANKEYRLSAYVYAEDDASIEVYVPTWDSNWKNGSDAGKTTVNVKAKTWTRIDHTITAADYARILQPRYTRWDSKTFYIDDITLTEVTSEPVPETVPELTVGFSKVDVDNSWYFTSDDIQKATAKFYKTTVTIDGTETEVVVEKTTDSFVIWPSFFTAIQSDGKLPTGKLEIKADTLMQEVTDKAWGTAVEGGQTLKVTNDLTVEKTSDGWKEAEDEQEPVELTMGFSKVDVDDSWYFTSDDIQKATAKFYKTTVTIDGTETEVVVEKTTDSFVIWPSFFTIIQSDGKLPTGKLEIKADTLLQEVTDSAWGTAVEGGQILKVTNDLTVKNTSDGWMNAEDEREPVDLTMGFGKVDIDNSWYLTADHIAEATAKFYITTVIIDGTETKVVVEKTTDSLVIWPSFFTIIQSDGKLPTEKLEIRAGTLLREINPDKSGWATPVVGGQKLKVTNDLTIKNTSDGWKNAADEREPIDLTLGFGKVDIDNSWYFTSDGIKKATAKFYKTTVTIDGTATEVVVEKTTDSFVIWPSFFTVIKSDSKLPTEKLELKAGTLLREVDPSKSGWGTSVARGQVLRVTDDLVIEKEGSVWMDAEYAAEIKNMEPLEVQVVFDQILDNGVYLKVITSDGTAIDSIYGNWTTARGEILRGVQDDVTGVYTYSSEVTSYYIADSSLYIGAAKLELLEGLQINAGTILYADKTCNSIRPIKITNQWRMIRDENDDWVVDKSFTTGYDPDAASDNSDEAEESNSSDSSEQEKETSKDAEIVSDEKQYSMGNILFHEKAGDDQRPVTQKGTATGLWILLLVLAAVLVAGGGTFLLLFLKKRKKDEENSNS